MPGTACLVWLTNEPTGIEEAMEYAQADASEDGCDK
jgi:hypothetical protein